jgi:hypothetical protein
MFTFQDLTTLSVKHILIILSSVIDQGHANGGCIAPGPPKSGAPFGVSKLYVKLVCDIWSRNLRKMNKILNILV